jgi:type IV pilus assembly protein PilW
MDTSIMIPNHHLQRGLTLTEIMVALTISTILMAGVFTIMSSSKRTYALQNELSELQENARFVVDELSWEIRMAGYQGCSSTMISHPFGGGLNDEELKDQHGNDFPPSDMLVITSFGEQLIPAANENFDDSTIVLDSRSLIPPDGSQITINDCGGSSVYQVDNSDNDENITLVKVEDPIRTFNKPVAIFMGSNTLGKQKVTYNDVIPSDISADDPTEGIIKLGASDPLPEKDDIITISDGQGSHSYLVTKINGQKITLRPPPRQFNPPVTLIYRNPDAATVYKVAYNQNEGGFALYKCDNAGDDSDCGNDPKEIFLGGVENMQIRYGLDTDNNNIPDLYSTAPTIPGYTTITKVNSIRLTLLMRTLQRRFELEGATDKDFRLDPNLTGDTDGLYNPQKDNAALESGYRHRLFTSTIQVRN